MQRRREIGRGERVLPGVWRLRLPVSFLPGVPHCNAWALAADGGVALVDTGMHEPESWQHLEIALHQCGLDVTDVRRIVCTHAHPDHCGQAAEVKRRTGAPISMHPDRRHMTAQLEDPDAVLAQRVEIARASGVPEAPLRRWAQQRQGQAPGVVLPLDVDHDLADGEVVATDLGEWHVLETPGHAPSHVVLHQRERRLLLSGDHVMGRVSLYFDHGYTPDPVGEFLASLDRVDALDVRLCLPGHGRTFTDLRGHVAANRRHVSEQLDGVRAAVDGGARTGYDVAQSVFGEVWSPSTASWLLNLTLSFLGHLAVRGDVTRASGPQDTEVWRPA